MKKILALILAVSSTLTFASETAPVESVVTVMEQKDHGMSEADVKAMNEISGLIQNNDKETALLKLNPILSRCEARTTESGKKYITVDSNEEYLEYVLESDKTQNVVWIKDSCSRAYKMAAFLFVESGDDEKAFNYLDKAINLAPFWAEPHQERGYLSGKQKDFKSAMDSYEKAIELADKYKNSAYIKPAALRGLGFILTEMGELDRAKAAYEQSLILEPGNKIAVGELDYIHQLQTQK